MPKTKLHYTFHNPNSVEATAEMLIRFLVEVNTAKVEEALLRATQNTTDETQT